MLTKLTSAGFALLLCLGVSSHGAVITDTATFGSLSIGAPSFTLALDKFDPALGTLTSVTLTLDAATCGNSFAFDNESSSAGSVTLDIGAVITAKTLLSLATTLEARPILTGSGWVKKDRHDGHGDFHGRDSFKVSGGASDSDSTTGTTAAYLAQYAAHSPGETFLVTIANSLLTNLATAGICGPTTACAGVFSGKITVAYSYLLVPVPECGTAFWGLGLGLFAALRRPRSRRG